MKKTLIKGVNITAQIAMIAYFSGVGVFLMPTMTSADTATIGPVNAVTVDLDGSLMGKTPGSIWTTRGDCGDEQQDVNHYNVGEEVWINGSGFRPNTYDWNITGQPGGASGDPGIAVASGQYSVGPTGSFCFDAYTVAADDWGEYKVTFGSKHDNYRVDVPTPPTTGSLKVTKVVNGAANPWDFGFRIVGWQGQYEYPVNPNDYVIFDDLDPGTYSVEETGLSNYVENNECVDISVVAGQESDCTITNTYIETPTYMISGFKFEDNNANRVWNAIDGEIGKEGWGIELYQADTKINDATTDSNGYYEFDNLLAGDYRVCEVPQANWVRTFPANSDCYDVTVGPSPFSTVAAYVPPISYDFGNFEYASVNGQKFNDKNSNTVWDVSDNELGLENWTINLLINCSADINDYDYTGDNGQITLADFAMFANYYGNKDALADINKDGIVSKPDYDCFADAYGSTPSTEPLVIKTEVTGVNGEYTFNGLEPGKYFVNEEMQANWTQTYPGGNQLVEINLISGSSIAQNFGNNTPEEPQEPEEPEEPITPAAPLIRVAKSNNSTTAAAGGNISYTVSWAVLDADVTGLVLTDALPAETMIVSVQNNGEFNVDNNTITWLLGDQTAGATGEVTYTVMVKNDVLDGTEIVNVATLDSAETDAVTASSTTAVTNVPVLTLTKSVDKTTLVAPGDTVNYTIKVENKGYAEAINVRLTDKLDSQLFYGDVLGSERTLTTGGNLSVGDSITFTYPVRVKSDTTTGTYSNTATLTADNHGTLTATVPISVQAGVVLGEETAAPSLSIQKSVDLSFANPGDTANYTVVINNNGEGDAVNVVLTDTLPTGFTFSETGGVTRTWKLGDLAAGKSTTVIYAVIVDSTVKSGTYDNVAEATADNHDKISATVGLEVREVQVLGEETEVLAETNMGVADYLILVLTVISVMIVSALWVRQSSNSRA